MSKINQYIAEYESTSNESNDISTSYSSSEDEELECRISKNIDIQDFEFLVERSNVFQKIENLYENILDKNFVMSNNVVLYYVLLLEFPKLLSFFDKKLKKSMNDMINENNIDKNNLYVICTNSLCGVDFKHIYNAFKSLEFKYDNYIFLSKCSYLNKQDKEDFKNVFKDIKSEDFDVVPDCLEEIFLLTVSKKYKNIVFHDKPYRLYLLTKNELHEYLEELKQEIF